MHSRAARLARGWVVGVFATALAALSHARRRRRHAERARARRRRRLRRDAGDARGGTSPLPPPAHDRGRRHPARVPRPLLAPRHQRVRSRRRATLHGAPLADVDGAGARARRGAAMWLAHAGGRVSSRSPCSRVRNAPRGACSPKFARLVVAPFRAQGAAPHPVPARLAPLTIASPHPAPRSRSLCRRLAPRAPCRSRRLGNSSAPTSPGDRAPPRLSTTGRITMSARLRTPLSVGFIAAGSLALALVGPAHRERPRHHRRQHGRRRVVHAHHLQGAERVGDRDDVEHRAHAAERHPVPLRQLRAGARMDDRARPHDPAGAGDDRRHRDHRSGDVGGLDRRRPARRSPRANCSSSRCRWASCPTSGRCMLPVDQTLHRRHGRLVERDAVTRPSTRHPSSTSTTLPLATTMAHRRHGRQQTPSRLRDTSSPDVLARGLGIAGLVVGAGGLAFGLRVTVARSGSPDAHPGRRRRDRRRCRHRGPRRVRDAGLRAQRARRVDTRRGRDAHRVADRSSASPPTRRCSHCRAATASRCRSWMPRAPTTATAASRSSTRRCRRNAALGEPGAYTMLWQAVSADGHSVDGEIPFTWAPTDDVEPSASPPRHRCAARRRRLRARAHPPRPRPVSRRPRPSRHPESTLADRAVDRRRPARRRHRGRRSRS